MKRIAQGKRGFTIVEIMVVVMIIGLLIAIAMPSFRRVRLSSMQKTCVGNLYQLHSAKELWALDRDSGMSDTPTFDDLNPFLRNDIWELKCPAGQDNYEAGLGAVGERPTCPNVGKYTDHVLPAE